MLVGSEDSWALWFIYQVAQCIRSVLAVGVRAVWDTGTALAVLAPGPGQRGGQSARWAAPRPGCALPAATNTRQCQLEAFRPCTFSPAPNLWLHHVQGGNPSCRPCWVSGLIPRPQEGWAAGLWWRLRPRSPRAPLEQLAGPLCPWVPAAPVAVAILSRYCRAMLRQSGNAQGRHWALQDFSPAPHTRSRHRAALENVTVPPWPCSCCSSAAEPCSRAVPSRAEPRSRGVGVLLGAGRGEPGTARAPSTDTRLAPQAGTLAAPACRNMHEWAPNHIVLSLVTQRVASSAGRG